MRLAALTVGASMILSTAAIASSDDLKPYPEPIAGQVQHVIRLPAIDDEAGAKVEIIAGRTMTIDCNHHFFGGQMEQKTAQGWGYDYYVLDSLGAGAATMMGCPKGSEREAFVRTSGETLVRYNSKLPLVIYTPDDVEVRYRIWQAGDIQSVTDH